MSNTMCTDKNEIMKEKNDDPTGVRTNDHKTAIIQMH